MYKRFEPYLRDLGKEKMTIPEHARLVNLLKKGKGKTFIEGMKLALRCGYVIENDYLTQKRIDLIHRLGLLKKKKRFVGVYEAMVDVGMGAEINDRGLSFLYKVKICLPWSSPR